MDSPDRTSFEIRNMHQVATLISLAALAREESRGGHYRTDFPSKSIAYEKHSVLQATAGAVPGNLDADITFR